MLTQLPLCPYCNSTDVGAESTFYFNHIDQVWVKQDIYDSSFFCRNCNEEFKIPSWFTTGTVISGTLRSQDLIPAFMERLSIVDPDTYAAMIATPFPLPPAYAMEDEHSIWWDSDECTQFTIRLMDLLNDAAPEGFYFGAHEGDGSDFGYWEEGDSPWD